MSNTLILALCACVIGALAQQKCQPEQWEARGFAKIAQDYKGKGQVLTSVMNITYDFSKKVQASHQELLVGDSKMMVSEYHDFNKMVSFLAYPDKKECKGHKLQDKMEKVCSDPSKAVASVKMGSQMADLYEFKGKENRVYITLLRDDLVTPVNAIVEQTYAGIPQMVSLMYGNFTQGISDPSVLVIPDYCKQP